MADCKCVKCSGVWVSRVAVPIACPFCKRRDWQGVTDYRGRPIVPPVNRKCGKCGYKWRQRVTSKIPLICPSCRRNDWQTVTPQDKCFMCGGRGCDVCVPVEVVAVACSNCHDRGMVAARGGCPVCGKVYEVTP